MNASWDIVILSTIVFLGAIRVKSIHSAKDFRMVSGGLGIVGIVVAVANAHLRWHLIWYTPLAIIAAYFFGLRRLFGLSRRLKRIGKSGISDTEQIRSVVQREIDEYNRTAPDEDKMR